MWYLSLLFYAYQFIYKYRCLKAKIIKTNFLGNDMPKKYALYCIAWKKHPQVYLEKCKYKTKKYKCPDS